MNLDITIHKGSPDRPVVIFIHGLGMDRHFWLDPLETRIFGKSIPMKVFAARRPRPEEAVLSAAGRDVQKARAFLRKQITIGQIPKKINNLWSVLMERGYNLVCWSQRRPVGPIGAAVEELQEISGLTSRVFPGKNIALVCHSRGGLIARKFMEKKRPNIKALITLSTPHKGSSLSLIGRHLSPLSVFIKGILPGHTHGTISNVMKSIGDLIEGTALKELMPGSDFFKNLGDTAVSGISYLSFGGRKTELVSVYKWKQEARRMRAKPVMVIPDSMIKIIPASLVPDEIIAGRGDVMVTVKSAVLPWAERHYNLYANHISITWNRKVISTVLELLDRL